MTLSPSFAESAEPAVSHDAGRAELVGPVPSFAEDDTTLTIAQAAKLRGVSPATLYRRILDGDLPAERDGRSYRISKKVVLEVGPLRKRDSREERARSIGRLAALAFPLFSAGVALDTVVVQLEADPVAVRSLFIQWAQLRELSATYLAPPATTPGPAFDHPPNDTWTCCPGHAAAHRMETKTT